MRRRLVIALLGAAVSIPPLMAQMRGSAGLAGFSSGHFSSGHGIRSGFAHVGANHQFARSRAALAFPYFYSDYYSEPDVIQVPSPEVVVVQAAPASAEAPPATPRALLIEWQGDHYARVTSAGEAGIRGQAMASDYAEPSDSRPAAVPRDALAAKAHDLPPAILLFRDGRKEEVSSYTIVGTVMYSSADYWSSGSWNKKIQLADLDVPGTLNLNRERGVSFVLPSAPNEVVTRP
jgi:hypothetical protein